MTSSRPTFLITAEEAYPAFERMVLAAREEVVISMRIFDPTTRLLTDAAKETGDTWADLLTARLADGLRFTILISDFDPVARPDMHRYSWESLARIEAAAAASGREELMDVDVMMHPDRVPWPQSIALFPMTRSRLNTTCEELNEMDADARAGELSLMPAFRDLVRERRGQLRPRMWPPAPLVPATHHQKLAVADGETLYIGGLDLNPRRYDTKLHDRASDRTWHDVQVLVHDARLATAARDHVLAVRENRLAPAVPGFCRTQSAPTDQTAGPLGPEEVCNELEEAHVELIRSAREFLYIETQFLRSSVIAEALVKAARDNPSLNLVVILPAAPEDVAFDGSDGADARYGEQLQSNAVTDVAEAFGGRVAFLTPAQPRPGPTDGRDSFMGAPIIYVHAKVMVADGERALVSSANLNARSMRWDTEAGLLIDDPEDAAQLLAQCRAHWLKDGSLAEPNRASHWMAAARANAALPPAERRHFLLPFDAEPAAEMGRPLPGIPEAMV